ncbi:amino acid permease [Levilactobacillus tujiorum]|uniref:amino acid permease n=1 Tax=Levilactobacillus tujiorum TaxID=2912243 RepID=UPI0014577905|nr:amino acid permease [Levilactobacillus tujiorum]NLR30948.1 amino acid permease [Levilactobacillus tujiorum]
MANEPSELARNLKNRHVQLIAIGGTIGTGLFLGSGKSIQQAGPAILIGYLIVGAACFLLMRALGELLLSNTSYRSFDDFVTEYLGEKLGFVVGWTYWICWITIAMAEITAIGIYIRFWFPSVPQWVPGLVVLAILLGLNLITVGAFGEVEFWFALIKIVAIIGLIVAGIVMLFMRFKTPVGHASLTNLVAFGGFFPKGISGFLLSLQMVVFSFIGIEMVGMTAAETRDPEKVLPKAINDIPLRIILFYVGALFIIMAIYPWQDVLPNQSPFVMVFKNVGIGAAADIINFVVITAAASACNSSIFTTGRMLSSLTKDAKRPLTMRLNKLSKHQVPGNALNFSALVITLAVVLNFLIPSMVFSLVSSVATTCFLFIWASIILTHLKFRRSAAAEISQFKAPWFPIADYAVLALLAIVAIILCFQLETAIALVLSLVWLVALYLVKRGQERKAA